MNFDLLLYSRGTYWLFEHWREGGKNIYSKTKYATQDDFIKGAGKNLTLEQTQSLLNGQSIIIKQPDGTLFFYKYINNL